MNISNKELTLRYAKQLIMYGNLIEISKATFQKLGTIRKELELLQNELIAREIPLQEVEEEKDGR